MIPRTELNGEVRFSDRKQKTSVSRMSKFLRPYSTHNLEAQRSALFSKIHPDWARIKACNRSRKGWGYKKYWCTGAAGLHHSLFKPDRVRILLVRLWKGVCMEKRESPVFKRFSDFYYYIMNISPIRQIDHAFIPHFFHWSGRYIKRQLLQDGFISDF